MTAQAGPPDARVVEDWLAGDPDGDDRAEIEALRTDPQAGAALAARFAAPLAFGTAGLRGPLRAGPAGMNTATVIRATAGLAAFLAARGAAGTPVVVGHDARHRSADFARAVAEVLAGAGHAVTLLPRALPTPVLAFAVRHTQAAAGVQVTASHNPAGDNGYKVYLAGGLPLAAPDDRAIEQAIADAPPAALVPRSPVAPADDTLVERYLTAVAGLPRLPARPLRIALTAVHGVGGAPAVAALRRAGYADVHVVAAQHEPDPDFPTAGRPNPEEPGVCDLLLARAAEVGADVAIALDPDADRCAVGVAGPDGRWRMLTGDETGLLMAAHVLADPRPEDSAAADTVSPLVATTLVSAPLLPALASARGARGAVTPTGFKHLMRAGAGLVYAYEEALGMAVAPDLVADKDGISAAVRVCEYAADLRARGRTLHGALSELAAELGPWAGHAVSVRLPTPDLIAAGMSRIRTDAPRVLAGVPVTMTDLARADTEEVVDAVAFEGTGSGAAAGDLRLRAVLRPSGTEPKLKVYLHARLSPGAPAGAGEQHRKRLRGVLDVAARELTALIGGG